MERKLTLNGKEVQLADLQESHRNVGERIVRLDDRIAMMEADVIEFKVARRFLTKNLERLMDKIRAIEGGSGD